MRIRDVYQFYLIVPLEGWNILCHYQAHCSNV